MTTTSRTFGQIRASGADAFIEDVIRELTTRFRGFEISDQQFDAWQTTFFWVWQAVQKNPQAKDDWLFLPEFNPPLSPIRPDLVIVAGNITSIIEFKAGISKVGNPARRQLEDYVNEMWNTMKGVRDSRIFPALISSGFKKSPASSNWKQWTPESKLLNELHPEKFSQFFNHLCALDSGTSVSLEDWKSPTYDLHPDIVQAASELIAHVEDRGVITHLSADSELDTVRDEVFRLIREAKEGGKKQVILISGVPGAGKTLIGLRLAHDPDLHDLLPVDSGTPLYLTGNGPLVSVLVEAIARDDKRRNPEKSMSETRSAAGSKVKLVHAITEKSLPINARVVVFDEGQRVWTAEHMKAKGKSQAGLSESEVILSAMETHNGAQVEWATLVVLIGSGQEINKGEAGASVWVDAVQSAPNENPKWDIIVPNQLAGDLVGVFQESKSLHLDVSRRALEARALSEWVALLLDGKFEQAANLREQGNSLHKFPIFLTRELEEARKWIRTRVIENRHAFEPTSGLVASSQSARLRAYGLEVGNQPRSSDVDWTKWFLDEPISLHSSSRLEVAGSEFKTQGLELDYVGVAWSWDLIIDANGTWKSRTINKGKAQWHGIKNEMVQSFRTNAYRVLLTRCRSGMIIYVPEGDSSDPSRSPGEIDRVYHALIKSGARTLNDTSIAQ